MYIKRYKNDRRASSSESAGAPVAFASSRKGRALVSVLLALCLSGLLAPSGAVAEVVSQRDPRGDAIPSVDVTRFVYANRAHVVSVHAYIASPAPRHTLLYAFYDPGHRAGKELYYTETVPRPGGGFKTTLYKLNVRVSQTIVRCPGLDVEWRRNGSNSGVRVRIPRSCLGTTPGPAYFRANVQHQGGHYSTDNLRRRHLSRN
jgi:hypothetical protein